MICQLKKYMIHYLMTKATKWMQVVATVVVALH